MNSESEKNAIYPFFLPLFKFILTLKGSDGNTLMSWTNINIELFFIFFVTFFFARFFSSLPLLFDQNRFVRGEKNSNEFLLWSFLLNQKLIWINYTIRFENGIEWKAKKWFINISFQLLFNFVVSFSGNFLFCSVYSEICWSLNTLNLMVNYFVSLIN